MTPLTKTHNTEGQAHYTIQVEAFILDMQDTLIVSASDYNAFRHLWQAVFHIFLKIYGAETILYTGRVGNHIGASGRGVVGEDL